MKEQKEQKVRRTLRRSLLVLFASVLCLTTAMAQSNYQLTGAEMDNATVVVKSSSGSTLNDGSTIKMGDVLSVSVTPNDGYYFSDGSTATKSGSITITSSLPQTTEKIEASTTGAGVEATYSKFKTGSGTWTQLSTKNTLNGKTSGWKVEFPWSSDSEKYISYTATISGKLSFDYIAYSGDVSLVRIYVNGEEVDTYQCWGDGSASDISVSSGDVIKWVFQPLQFGDVMTEEGYIDYYGYLGNVKITPTETTTVTKVDISKSLTTNYAVHQHNYDKTTGLCTVCGTEISYSYTLADLSNASKFVKSVVVKRGSETLKSGATLTSGDEITASITLNSCALWSDNTSLAASTARSFSITVGASDPNETIREKIALAVHGQTGLVSGVCNTCGYYAALTYDDLVDGAYQLKHAGDLMAFADIVNGTNGATETQSANAKVADDASIDFTNITSVSYTPITWYKGTFDGNGKTITLKINSTSDEQGIFGIIRGATIKNVNVAGTVSGANYVAGLVAYIYISSSTTTVTNCHNYATITSSGSYAGGIVGNIQGVSTITDCSNNASVSGGGSSVGGIVGNSQDENVTIENCVNNASVYGSGEFVGGIMGYGDYANITITKCVNNGDIDCGNANAAGIVGWVNARSGNKVAITACANRGAVTATKGNNGAIIGYFDYSLSATSCYNENSENSSLPTYALTSGNGTVSFTRCYNINSVSGDVATNFTSDQLASGELCYNLNGGSTDVYWYQTLGTDATPVLSSDSKIVYYYKDCVDESIYSNTEGGDGHSYGETGLCTLCEKVYAEQDNITVTDGVYQIATADNLVTFAKVVNDEHCTKAKATVTSDIDASSASYTPIGSASNYYYAGEFDGGEHTITLNINNTSSYNQGLFGHIGAATIKNVTVAGTIKGKGTVGGIAGYIVANGATITNCHNTAAVSCASANLVGGIVGYARYNLTISDCTNKGSVYGVTGRVGGIIGSADGANVVMDNCVNESEGTVSGGSKCWDVGGIFGFIYTSSWDKITNCANRGTVSGPGYVGGIVGNLKVSGVTFEKCVNDGTVSASTGSRAGGIIASTHESSSGGSKVTLIACANRGAVSNVNNDSYLGAIIGKFDLTFDFTSCYNMVSGLTFYGTKGSNKTQTFTRCYNITDCSNATTFTSDELTSGALCYNLNGGVKDMYWFQKLGSDEYPVLTTADEEANVVNCIKNIDESEARYFNTPDAATPSVTNTDAAKFFVLDATPTVKLSDTNVNVLVPDDEGNYTCDNVVLLDGTNYAVPYDYTAARLIYERTLKTADKGINTFILPAVVSVDDINGTVYKLNDYEDGVLKFEEMTGTLEANTPYLVQCTADADGNAPTLLASTLENVTVKAMTAGSVTAGDATHIGTYVAKNSTDNADEFSGNTLYGYMDGAFVKATGTWTLNPFRTLITVSSDAAVNALALDLDGGGAATAVGGYVLGSAAPVDVYTLSGIKLRTATPRSEALRDLPAGVYIVGGEKVIKN